MKPIITNNKLKNKLQQLITYLNLFTLLGLFIKNTEQSFI